MGWRAATTWANVLALAAASATNPRCSDSIEAAATAGCLEAGPDAQDLHLGAGQKARSGPAWGAGLIEEVIEVDVFVAGGGSAGTSAALAAARSGASTVIVDGRPVLGGNSGSEIRVTMVGACGPRSGQGNDNAFVMDCREGGIVEEYILENAAHNQNSVPELFSIELLTLMKAEPNLDVFLNTWLVSVTTEPGPDGVNTITSAICENQGSQRRYIVKAKVYIDASGDGRLGAEAGAEFIQGREGKADFNESIAVDVADNETEGTSILYMASNTGTEQTFTPPFWAPKYNKSEFQYRSVDGTVPIGYWWNEVSWPYNTITDGENVTHEGIGNILGIWDYIKNSGNFADAATMALSWVGQVGGKREGRRFRGQYIMNQNDVYPNAIPGHHWKPGDPAPIPELFWDRVAYSGWSFDLHNPMGMNDPSHPPFVPTMTPYMFSTPLRSLVSKDLTNLFFAGRLASFTHVVFGSQRVMKTCATQGQAAGTAAAFAITRGMRPIDLKTDPDAVWSIQQQLIRDDAFLIGVFNEDPRDYAKSATVSATSEFTQGHLDGSAINVISGQSRAVVGPLGVPPSQAKNGTNRWISSNLPAAISLQLPQPVPIAQVELIFDTAMHRKLSFSPDGNRGTPWAPQPETVRDYVIEGRNSDGQWSVLCNVTGNYQRRRVHTLPCNGGGPPPPAPPPPPVTAPGAISADLCTAAPNQLWTFSTDGTVSNDDGSGKRVCLGYNSTVSAYGGEGSAVVALPCDAQSPTWKFVAAGSPQNGQYLESVPPAPCSAMCDASAAKSFTVAGAGLADVNGVYTPTSKSSDGIPVFQKDDTHQLYRYQGVWKLAEMGTGVYYSASPSGASAGPPKAGASWQVGDLGKSPTPSLISCEGKAAECPCVHAVACAACHTTGTAGQRYIPPTSVELVSCSDPVSHLQWFRLSIDGASESSAMIMSDGLCLGTAGNQTAGTRTQTPTAGPVGPYPRPSPRKQFQAPTSLQALSDVRVTVTATNGYDKAIVNEIRLYDTAGVAPFPKRPAQ